MADMPDPVAAADEPAPDGGETVAASVSPGPDDVEPAWSREDDEGDAGAATAARQSWKATWRKAAVLLVGGLAVAGAIVMAFWLLSPADSPAPATGRTPSSSASSSAAASSSASSSAASAVPSSIASTPEQDQKYVRDLNDHGISFANPQAAIYNGKMVCQNISQGMTVPQVVVEFRASNPALGADADAYVAISVHAYCPQHDSSVNGG